MSVGSLIGGAVGAGVGFLVAGPVGAIYGGAIGFGLGMAVDPIQPDLPGPGRPEVGKFQVTTAEEGVPIGDLLGTTKLTGNIFWYAGNRVEEITETQEGQGKGGPESQTVVTGYKYYLSWAMGICMGPVDALLTVYRGDTVVWDGELTRPPSGGEETITLEGMGSMTFFFGTSDQQPPSAMTNLLEDPTLSPAYRHQCYAFFNDCYIGDYNRVPQMKFVLRKAPTFAFSALSEIEIYQYNAAHAIWYVLEKMLGLDPQYLDVDSFESAAYRLFYEGRGVCNLMKQQVEGLRIIETILSHIDGVLFWGVNGKLQLKLMREEANIDSLPLINADVFIDDPTLDRKSWLDTLNDIKVQYPKLITSERETCNEPAPVLVLNSCPGLNNGEYSIVGGCAPFEVQTSLAGGPWTFQRQVYTRTFNYLCTQYLCSGVESSRKVRVVDANGRASNDLDANLQIAPDLVWAGNKTAAAGDSVLIGASGGKLPYRFSVSGFGWWFDDAFTIKELETFRTDVHLYHDGRFCESAGVLVTDACGKFVSGWVFFEGSSLAFDDDSTPDTISPGESAILYITGGVPPFDWTVSGVGFSLGQSQTTQRSNILSCAPGT